MSFVYDDDLQRQIGIFLGRVQENLEQLRKEMPAVCTDIRAALGNAADQRIATVKAQQEKDKKLNFRSSDTESRSLQIQAPKR